MDPTAIQAGAPPQVASVNGTPPEVSPGPAPRRQEKSALYRAFETLASLRITVVTFVFALFLVFYGTLAQRETGLHTVVDRYFRSFVVWVPTPIFLANVNHINKLFNVEAENPLFDIPGAVPFPAGRLLAAIMFTNLTAAYLLRFKVTWRKAGILMIHAGILTLMAGELTYQLGSTEGLMPIEEGKSANYVVLTDKAELAFERSADAKTDEIISIPAAKLQPGTVLDDDQLPVLVKVVDYMPNANVLEPRSGDKNPATAGRGLHALAVREAPVSGVSSDRRDAPATYLTFLDRATKKELGTYLFATGLEPEWITLGEKQYQVSLRDKRSYRNFTIHLEKFDFKKFQGTDMAKDYRSHVVLNNPETNENRRIEIYMNTPLRYQGETFYQASVLQDADKRVLGTVLQVVRNPGWLLPYVSCCLVGLGMLLHFGLTLIGFIEKQAGLSRDAMQLAQTVLGVVIALAFAACAGLIFYLLGGAGK